MQCLEVRYELEICSRDTSQLALKVTDDPVMSCNSLTYFSQAAEFFLANGAPRPEILAYVLSSQRITYSF